MQEVPESLIAAKACEILDLSYAFIRPGAALRIDAVIVYGNMTALSR
jgi:hypothetical protein